MVAGQSNQDVCGAFKWAHAASQRARFESEFRAYLRGGDVIMMAH